MLDQFKEIENSDSWKQISKINKGWSYDNKYHILGPGDKEFLLRTNDASLYKKWESAYNSLENLKVNNHRIALPVQFGYFNNRNEVYLLFNWIKGKDAIDLIPKISQSEQYKLGCDAGEILKEIHQNLVKEPCSDWCNYYNSKIDGKIIFYNNCEKQFPKGHLMLDFIDKNRHLLKSRPQCFHHGDFHIGNMVLDKNNNLGLIDFNRLDFGDPWEEFNRITWCADLSPHFASGRINSYFNNKVPSSFFKLMALYICVNQLSTLPWSIPFGQKEIEVAYIQNERILKSYNDFNTYVPNWYIQS